MMRTLYHLSGQHLRADVPVKEFAALLKQPDGLLWVDFDAEPDAAVEPILTGIFRFHRLAVDDALEETHTPKIDDWGEYVYIVLNAMDFDVSDGLTLSTTELDIFLGPNYIVTHHDQPIPALEKAREAFGRDRRYTAHGPRPPALQNHRPPRSRLSTDCRSHRRAD